MNDREFEKLLRETAIGYRVPPEAPLDRLWPAIEARAFGPRVVSLIRRPWVAPVAFAATLVLGIGLGYGGALLQGPGTGGRGPRAVAPAAAPAPASAASSTPSPFVGLASDYLEQTALLILTVAGEDSLRSLSPATVARARSLLSTTRLLLDAGVGSPALLDLLRDVELVLAQVVRLPPRPPASDARYVSEALAERDVLPRLTLLLADARGAQ
jgi:hypothetical protein